MEATQRAEMPLFPSAFADTSPTAPTSSSPKSSRHPERQRRVSPGLAGELAGRGALTRGGPGETLVYLKSGMKMGLNKGAADREIQGQ